jgi:Protein of unknown function (DUF2934)
MKDQPQTVVPKENNFPDAIIGNAADYRRAILATIAKRAYEIYECQGHRRGHNQENWYLAESEILQPLFCGILESKDKSIVSLFSSALDAKDTREIEVVAEPHRLILIGKKQPDSQSEKQGYIYRVLPLKEEFDPSSLKLRQNGPLLDIEIHKVGVSEKATGVLKAA